MTEKTKEHGYSHILKYTGIFGGVQMLSVIVGIVRNKFTAIFLGAAGMGLLSLFNSTVNMLVSATNLGIPTSGVTEIARHYTENNHPSRELLDAISLIRSWAFLSALFGTLLCVMASPFLDTFSFSWGNHKLHYLLLAPIVGLTIIGAGETAVLKATRQLRSLIFSSLCVIIASLVVAVPVYWLWNVKGILLVLFAQAFVQMASALFLSIRRYPYRISLSFAMLRKGKTLIKLGVAFVVAGVCSTSSEFVVRSWLNTQGNLSVVGLFNAASTLAIVYVGFVFSAMDSDYYPHLCAITDLREQNVYVSRQVEVDLMLVGPLLQVLLFALPILIPLLYNDSFLEMQTMVRLALVSMIFKSVYIPIEYLPLAKGRGSVYLFQEVFAVLLLMAGEMLGFRLMQLAGIGIGFIVAYLVEMLFVLAYSRIYFGYILPLRTLSCFFQQLVFVLLSFWIVVRFPFGFTCCLLGVLVCLSNVALTLFMATKHR